MTTAHKITVPLILVDEHGKETQKIVRLDEVLDSLSRRLRILELEVKQMKEDKA